MIAKTLINWSIIALVLLIVLSFVYKEFNRIRDEINRRKKKK